MDERDNLEELLLKKLDKLNGTIVKNNVIELSEILGNTKKMIVKNFFSGIAKGIGIGIGVTLLTAILIFFLQRLVRLNIPVIGDYIADIVEIVENNR